MNAPQFINRWRITGLFTTASELHIGDGDVGAPYQRAQQPKDEESEVATVCTDHRGCAYIPASAIKGVLRSKVLIAGGNSIPKEWTDLFGAGTVSGEEDIGGKLEFHDAFHSSGLGKPSEDATQAPRQGTHDLDRPYWDDTRRTCVAVAVSLDRRTRTALENHLYSLEYVPVGESFEFTITGENLTEGDIQSLLALLKSPSGADSQLSFGAQASNSWGMVETSITSIHRLQTSDLSEWVKQPSIGLNAAWNEIPRDSIACTASAIAPGPGDILTIDLRLKLTSPWLIRDSRQKARSEADSKLDEKKRTHPKNAVPIHDSTGRAYVPAKSLRGALRARAEMILRTLNHPCAPNPSDLPDVSELKDVKTQDLAARLFGLSGWLAPLHVPRLTSTKSVPEHNQEFVAIDRFTGGSADGAKFNATLAGAATVAGRITINLSRLKLVDDKFRSLGLLALVLRDLAEGDISIGSGSSKGQGACIADATVIESGTTHTSLRDWFEHSEFLKSALPAFRNPETTN